jgi:ubiquinone/menaquinone biosynthesis C-methylase UbiE
MTLYRLARRTAGKIVRAVPWLRRRLGLSADYQIVGLAQARRRQARGWHSSRIAANQDAAYQQLMDAMHRGTPRIDLTVAARAVDRVGLSRAGLLEIGCGSGYYSEILAALAQSRIDYTGIDYSAAMIARARARYPDGNFVVGDATALAFPDASFDIAFNGVSLMHILDYEKAIAESARIARRAAIFHSVPVFADHPTTFLHKYAYGGAVVEAVFNRDELLACFAEAGLSLVQSWPTIPYDVSAVTGAASHAETFLCEKTA